MLTSSTNSAATPALQWHNIFGNRVINVWNSLSQNTVAFTTLNMFKSSLSLRDLSELKNMIGHAFMFLCALWLIGHHTVISCRARVVLR